MMLLTLTEAAYIHSRTENMLGKIFYEVDSNTMQQPKDDTQNAKYRMDTIP